MSYVFKYAESKVNDDGKAVWAIRQTGLYQRYDLAAQTHAWFVVLPNYTSCDAEQLVDMFSTGTHPLQAHIEFFCLRLRNWRWYISDFEKRYQKSVSSELRIVDIMNEVF
jgi:hypothetical protein